MAEIRLPAEAQQMLMEIQMFQQQMQAVSVQKETLSLQNTEIEKALEELAKSKDSNDVYKAIGPILIKATAKSLEAELKEKKETIGLRLKSLEKQEARIRDKLKEVQEKLEGLIKSSQGKGPPAAE